MAKDEDKESLVKIRNDCAVKSCNCRHEYQDKVYGKGMRTMNGCRGGYCCTVCGVKKDNRS